MALKGIFCFTGPFLVKCCFDRNIGMWGVQIIATKCLDHYTQLQLILNHPIGENVQNFFWGALLRTKKPFWRSLVVFSKPQKCIMKKTRYSRVCKTLMDSWWTPSVLVWVKKGKSTYVHVSMQSDMDSGTDFAIPLFIVEYILFWAQWWNPI